MIVVETVLREIFTQLPQATIDSKQYPIRFSWGSQKDCNLHIASIKSTNKYPLIWLVQGIEEGDFANHKVERNIRLLIAKNSQRPTSTNPPVWDSEFENVLNPLLKNVITALTKSGVTTIIGSTYKIERRANYSETDEKNTYTIDNWNVIVFEAKVRFEEKADGTPLCINTIRF